MQRNSLMELPETYLPIIVNVAFFCQICYDNMWVLYHNNKKSRGNNSFDIPKPQKMMPTFK